MKHVTWYLTAAIAVLIGVGAVVAKDDTKKDPPDAVAHIVGAKEPTAIKGLAQFYQKENGVFVSAMVSGLTPGDHGFHVHENGSCDDAGKAAGGHFNPHGVEHGYLPDDGLEHAHLGDMGNITIGEDGSGKIEVLLPHVTLTGDNGISGKAVIVHAGEDDFGQPVGNAGDREACGIIEASELMVGVPQGGHDHEGHVH